MIELIGAQGGLSPEDAYALCSIAADLKITQVVNQSRGVHCSLQRWALGT